MNDKTALLAYIRSFRQEVINRLDCLEDELIRLGDSQNEQPVLIQDSDAWMIGTVAEVLKPEDFYDPIHRKFYEVILSLYSSNTPVDFVTVQDELKKLGLFEQLGGQPFLAQLIGPVTTTSNTHYHAEIVKDNALRRRMIEASDRIVGIVRNPRMEYPDIVSEVEKEILKASQDKEISSPVSLYELSGSVMSEIESIYRTGGRRLTGYVSGFRGLDRIISGFQPGSPNIIAARPSMGKTALALNIAQFGGEQGKNPCVLIFSLEMSREQLMQRMFSAHSGVRLSEMSSGTMSEEDFGRKTESCGVVFWVCGKKSSKNRKNKNERNTSTMPEDKESPKLTVKRRITSSGAGFIRRGLRM